MTIPIAKDIGRRWYSCTCIVTPLDNSRIEKSAKRSRALVLACLKINWKARIACRYKPGPAYAYTIIKYSVERILIILRFINNTERILIIHSILF